MADEKLLTRVKTCLRTTTTAFDDDEILPLIDACKSDLKGAGVDLTKNTDLVEQAIIFYCKGYFGLNPVPEWVKQYEKTRDALASRISEVEE